MNLEMNFNLLEIREQKSGSEARGARVVSTFAELSHQDSELSHDWRSFVRVPPTLSFQIVQKILSVNASSSDEQPTHRGAVLSCQIFFSWGANAH